MAVTQHANPSLDRVLLTKSDPRYSVACVLASCRPIDRRNVCLEFSRALSVGLGSCSEDKVSHFENKMPSKGHGHAPFSFSCT